ncbi:NADH:flavin oxidoreductase [Salinisphaera sp. PC39]|uniref:oxidoreductase n=1 Tax=Salinisphaera sp. PC39 TaxID=1304156 RepID=UPI0033419010
MTDQNNHPGEDRYPTLFSPLTIGNMQVRNRIMQTAHAKVFGYRDGLTNRREIHYQRERARGGIGLMITGNRLVHPTSNTASRGFNWGYRKEIIERERALTDAVHEHGAKIIAQQNHFGVNGSSSAMDDYRVLWSASNVKSPAFGETPKPMEPEDLESVAEHWALCCAYSREGGFDGVEVHLAHSYLLHQFISELFNKRTDEYGGSFENRMRYPLEVIRRVRERVGDDFVVGIRIPLTEMAPGGFEVDTAVRIAKTVADTGLIDYVNTTAATYHNIGYGIPTNDVPEGWLLERLAQVKAAVDLPVFAVGGIKDPTMAENALRSGQADMIAMTREQIADPEYARKLREGRDDEITHCIRCNQGCIGRLFQARPITCILTPGTGREERLGRDTLVPAANPGHWAVIGGGPAGMKAAVTLAERGHRVTLFERDETLGGQIKLVLEQPHRGSFAWIPHDLGKQMDRLGVDVRLGTAADRAAIEALAPDGVIVATGSQPRTTGFSSVNPMVPVVPGTDQDNVLTTPDVLRDPARAGKRTLILDDDGSRYVLGTAERLLAEGCAVHIVTRFNGIGPNLAPTLDLPMVLNRLGEGGMEYTVNHWIKSIEGDTATVFDIFTGREKRLEGFDSFLLCTGHEAEDGLYFELKEALPNVHRIGDCHAPRQVEHAIYEGVLAGRELFDPATRYFECGELEQWP